MASDGYTACNGYTNVLTVYRNFDAATNYKICNRASGLCLDVAGKSTSAGALIDQTAYASQLNQKFGFVAMSNTSGIYSFPTYNIVNRNSGKSLALPKQSTASRSAGAAVDVHQGRLSAMDGPSGRRRRRTRSATGARTPPVASAWASAPPARASGAAVVQQSYTAAASQQWTISLAN